MHNLYHFFIEPFQYPFMQHALIMAIVVSSVCAILSCYLVLKGWSLMGDAISHAVLPGIVLAYILNWPLAIGAFLSGLFCALFTGYLKNNSRLKEDTVMGIVFSGMFAIGVVVFTKVESDQHLTHILFGNLLGIPFNEFLQTIIISLVALIIVSIKWKDFMLYCFDVVHTRTTGLPLRTLHYGLLILLSLTIVSAMQVVGVILVVAMLISPGITAFLLSKQFKHMLWIALTVSLFSTLLGTVLSFHIDASTGAVIIVLQACLFVLALIYNAWNNRHIHADPKITTT